MRNAIKVSFLLLISLFFSTTNAYNIFNNNDIQNAENNGYSIGNPYSSISECEEKRYEYNDKYPDYKRTDCFKKNENNKYYYFLCSEDKACDISSITGNSSSQGNSSNGSDNSSSSNSNNNSSSDNSVLTPSTNKCNALSSELSSRVEPFFSKIRQTKATKTDSEYTTILNGLKNRLLGLQSKYSSNTKIMNLVGCIVEFIEGEKYLLSQNNQQSDIDQFFCELEGTCGTNESNDGNDDSNDDNSSGGTASCSTANGVTIEHNKSKNLYYDTGTSSCSNANYQCNNGKLSKGLQLGYTFDPISSDFYTTSSSCNNALTGNDDSNDDDDSSGGTASCSTANGVTIEHNKSKTLYYDTGTDSCSNANYQCNNGKLSKGLQLGYTFTPISSDFYTTSSSCNNALTGNNDSNDDDSSGGTASCSTANGVTIEHNKSKNLYYDTGTSSCSNANYQCNNGKLSKGLQLGYTFDPISSDFYTTSSSCNNALTGNDDSNDDDSSGGTASCSTANGVTIEHNKSKNLYYDTGTSSCSNANYQCRDGKLSKGLQLGYTFDPISSDFYTTSSSCNNALTGNDDSNNEGVCGMSIDSCKSGTMNAGSNNSQFDNSTYDKWYCNGKNGKGPLCSKKKGSANSGASCTTTNGVKIDNNKSLTLYYVYGGNKCTSAGYSCNNGKLSKGLQLGATYPASSSKIFSNMNACNTSLGGNNSNKVGPINSGTFKNKKGNTVAFQCGFNLTSPGTGWVSVGLSTKGKNCYHKSISTGGTTKPAPVVVKPAPSVKAGTFINSGGKSISYRCGTNLSSPGAGWVYTGIPNNGSSGCYHKPTK